MANVSAAGSVASQLMVARWQSFARWWLAGLQEIVPQAWRTWADSEAPPQVLVRRVGETIICRLTSAAGALDARLPAAGFDSGALATWLEQQGLTREGVVVGPVIARDQFLVRELSVPTAALGVLPKILDQEVLRRTPFQLSEIWHAASAVAGGSNDVVTMCHWIIRKDRAEVVLAELGLMAGEVDFLAVGDSGGDVVPVISFRSSGEEDPPWSGRAMRLLAGATLLACVCGAAVFEWRQASVAAAIESELAEARRGAQSGRDGIDPVGRLLAMRADVSVLEVWAELSRILPDHTFLTESRIADSKVTMTGFSSDAARLVRIIDQSPLFSGAALTAAITPDATEHKDRFSISFRVRGGRPSASSRSGSQ
ncbi:PilN domain-containing protein [Bradyrhizobium lablabi]|uniref:PilN domain-containing protein n=1 Tax=Bradyrhizobium lablabi TaxID=722472 RepID=UPI00090A066F|nr:PilN domain-containing protein [Bradyrhizobium lablabi]SHK62955.1 general secretion pathway protein L [Bradyrhizobium lablabi]